jgi:NitT/TauT family transport system substrate-binding protein
MSRDPFQRGAFGMVPSGRLQRDRSKLAPARCGWRETRIRAKERPGFVGESRGESRIMSTTIFRLAGLAIALATTLGARPATALDKVTFGTDWKAEAEHGGFYQAIAAGIYAKHGLEVTLRQGGPQINHAQLLAAGRLDFNLASNSLIPLNFVKEGIPMLAVAAFFQKDPQALLAHPGEGNDSLEALKGKPIMIGNDTRIGSWLFLKAKFGYTDDQIRPYTFSIAPFLADKKAIQQGYVTSETFLMESQGIKPVVMLLADQGYTGYAAVLQTSQKLVAENPDLVQRFVDASSEGWKSFLEGDPAPAFALIKKDNPEMTDDLLKFGRAKLEQYGIVDSGDAKTHGIGAMTDARWSAFFQLMSAQGVYPADMDWKKAYTLRFVDKPLK